MCIPRKCSQQVVSAAVDLMGVHPSLTPVQVQHRVLQDILIESEFNVTTALSKLEGTLHPRALRNLRKQQAGDDVWVQIRSLHDSLMLQNTEFVRG